MKLNLKVVLRRFEPEIFAKGKNDSPKDLMSKLFVARTKAPKNTYKILVWQVDGGREPQN